MANEDNMSQVLIGISAVLLGLWSLFVGISFTILGGFAGLDVVLIGLIAIAAGIGFFAVTVGLFTTQPWTGQLGIAVFGVDFARRMMTFITEGVTFFAVSAAFTLVSGAGLAYFVLNKETF